MTYRVDELSSRYIIGNTPMVFLETGKDMATIALKLEGNSQGGSTKDRAVWGMLRRGEDLGQLKPGGVIVEPTSGNTGIALAMLGKALDQRIILTMPESMSSERRSVLSAYGAELILTPASRGMTGAIEEARRLVQDIPDAWMLDQFANPGNPWAHSVTTGPEILKDLRGRKVDAFVAGVGTGGTLTGISRSLLSVYPDMDVVAVEPAKSPVLSSGVAGPHGIQGIGAGFVPGNLDRNIVTKVIAVEDEDSFEGARDLSSVWGLFSGISSGANFVASLEVAREVGPGGLVVTVLPDRGDKYISTGIYR